MRSWFLKDSKRLPKASVISVSLNDLRNSLVFKIDI